MVSGIIVFFFHFYLFSMFYSLVSIFFFFVFARNRNRFPNRNYGHLIIFSFDCNKAVGDWVKFCLCLSNQIHCVNPNNWEKPVTEQKEEISSRLQHFETKLTCDDNTKWCQCLFCPHQTSIFVPYLPRPFFRSLFFSYSYLHKLSGIYIIFCELNKWILIGKIPGAPNINQTKTKK